jgi:hypothetical protein
VADRATEPLLRELVRELAPVRRIPRLRATLALALLLWLAAVAVHALVGGPSLRGDAGRTDPASLAVLVGLAAAGLGAALAALADAVPGRAAAARAGCSVALAGGLLALAGGAASVAVPEAPGSWLPAGPTLACMGRASALGALPALVLCAFLARAVARRPRLGAGLAGAGAVALGAVAVQATCPHMGGVHVLVGHALVPFAAALALAPLVSPFLRRGTRPLGGGS